MEDKRVARENAWLMDFNNIGNMNRYAELRNICLCIWNMWWMKIRLVNTTNFVR